MGYIEMYAANKPATTNKLSPFLLINFISSVSKRHVSIPFLSSNIPKRLVICHAHNSPIH